MTDHASTAPAAGTRPAGPGTRAALVVAPLCVLAGIGALVWFFTAESAHADAQRAACGDLPQNSAGMYAAAWSALVLGALARTRFCGRWSPAQALAVRAC